ncbi:Urea ABC transporter, permease protein UrtB [hydrothermal vent metagenome]|uniref:Urea ABC transporter, permease protein UrtB n=1 Tax=hydrothermal vent metagenome TaxID=652676 RepID=A0A3B0Z6G6_9ZZZZ
MLQQKLSSFRFVSTILLAAVLVLSLFNTSIAQAEQSEFAQAVASLAQKNFKKKEQALNALSQFKDERVEGILNAMLESRLYYLKSDQTVVFIKKIDGLYQLNSVLNQELLGTVDKKKIKKITVNNRLRKKIRVIFAKIKLNHADAKVRLIAVNEILKKVSPETLIVFREINRQEKDEKVLAALAMGMALSEIDSGDVATQLNAINVLSESLHPAARAKVAALSLSTKEITPAVRQAAQKALKKIEGNLEFYAFLETLFFGLSLGSVLLLAAIGLSITFGVMGVINMAHGELIMIGAYTTYVIQLLMPNNIGMSVIVAIPAAFIIAGLVGIAIERGVIRFLYGRPLETLLATFGISLILQQLVRSVFSPLNRVVETPAWMSGSWEINAALAITYNRLYIVIFSLMVFFALLVFLKKSVFGLQMRAVTQNRQMAKAMGIRSTWVDALTFGLGSGIAGVAGVALSQLTNVGPNLGQAYIIDSFMVVVFGGVGNLWGTLVAAFSLGVVNKFLEPWAGAVLAKILVLVFIILFIQSRPKGLFPQKGRAAEN